MTEAPTGTEATDTPITDTPTADKPQKPDGFMKMQMNKQTFIIELFFNHDSKETFQDRLLRIIHAEKKRE